MATDIEAPPRGPQPVRAVFSTEDFGLLRVAVAHYLSNSGDGDNRKKYGNLYHRLGRLS